MCNCLPFGHDSQPDVASQVERTIFTLYFPQLATVQAVRTGTKDRRATLALDLPVRGRFMLGAELPLELKMEFEVTDMSCGGCANSITRALISADPTAKLDIDIDIATRIVKVDSVLPSERLVAVIEDAGFHPTVNA